MNADWIHAFWPVNSKRQYNNDIAHADRLSIGTNYLKEAWRFMPLLLIAQQISSGLAYTFPIIMVVILSDLVVDTAAVSANYTIFIYLLALVFSQFLNNVWMLWIRMEINERMCRKIYHLTHAHLKIGLSQDLVNRISGRDFGIVIENSYDALELFSLTIVLLLSSYFVYGYYGIEVTLSLVILSVYIPLTIYLSKKGNSLYSNIMRISARRVEECSRWIQWGIFLNNWKKTNKLYSITSQLQNEVNYRNKDSIVRGIDVYVSSFGRSLPFILVGFYFLNDQSAKENMFGIFWLAFPILTILLRYPRIYVAFKNMERALTEISSIISTVGDNKKNETPKRSVDQSWKIYQGTIAENIFYTGSRTDDLFHAFNFIPEFGETIESVLKYRLEPHGNNLSEGQKVRLITARAINMALEIGTKFDIKLRFASIDKKKFNSVLNYISKPEIARYITLRHEHDAELQSVFQTEKINQPDIRVLNSISKNSNTERSRDKSKSKPNEKKSHVLKDLVGLWRFEALFMIVPAFILTYLGHLAYQNLSNIQLMSMFAMSLIGFLAAVLLGALIEKRIRAGALGMLLNGLKKINDVADNSDKFQVISRDYLTVNERISWYCHDLAWMISLIVILAVVIIVTTNIYGIAILALYGLLFTFLWKKLIPHIITSRLESVDGVNVLLKSMQNVNSINHNVRGLVKNNSIYEQIYRYRKKHAYYGMREYYVTQSQMLATKSCLAIYAQLGSGLFLLSIMAVVYFSLAPPAFIAVLLTAFLMVEGEVTRLFLAVSGFKSQVLSLHRLKGLSVTTREDDQVLNYKSTDGLTIDSFCLRSSKFKYDELSLDIGGSYSLIGSSGSGKSQYLKGAAGFEKIMAPASSDAINESNYLPSRHAIINDRKRIIYCDHQFIHIMAWESGNNVEPDETSKIAFSAKQQDKHLSILLDFAKKMMRTEMTVLIYDEALSCLNIHNAKSCAQQIESITKKYAGVFIIVDHRFELKNSIPITDLISINKKNSTVSVH